MRAGAENLRAGRVVQGGSTITQQLAKNLFLTNERSWRRKAQEVAMAIWLETRFTKDEILALYLNVIFFGQRSYGVAAAAETYFRKPAANLSPQEAAFLSAMIPSPLNVFNPQKNLRRVQRRQRVILRGINSVRLPQC